MEYGLDERHARLYGERSDLQEISPGSTLFSLIYAFSEQFILPLSHDEVVHMKKSLLSKMPGDDWQKFANLRLLYTYMFGHPGKKLLFMGSEFGQWSEWTEAHSIDWHLLQWENHKGVQNLVKDLNQAYLNEPAFHEVDSNWEGFEWIDISDADNSILSFVRRGEIRKIFWFSCSTSPNSSREV
jgi:1,4-alpha-glucan branching enzyme